MRRQKLLPLNVSSSGYNSYINMYYYQNDITVGYNLKKLGSHYNQKIKK